MLKKAKNQLINLNKTQLCSNRTYAKMLSDLDSKGNKHKNVNFQSKVCVFLKKLFKFSNFIFKILSILFPFRHYLKHYIN